MIDTRNIIRLTLSFRGRTLSAHEFDQEEILIGRDPASDVAVDSLAVGPRHARIRNTAEGVVLEALDSNFATTVNGVAVEESPLHNADEVMVGKHALLVHIHETSMPKNEAAAATATATDGTAATNAPALAPGFIQILSGPDVGRVIPLDSGMARLGDEGSASAMISRRDSGYFISHLDGDQTTLVGTEKLGEDSMELSNGVIITLGKTRMQFFLDAD